MGSCCASAKPEPKPKPVAPSCTIYWETNDTATLKEQGQVIADILAAWGKGDLAGKDACNRITGDVLNVSRLAAAGTAMVAGATAGASRGSETMQGAVKQSAVDGAKAAGQNGPVSGTLGVGGLVGAAVGGLVGAVAGAVTAGMGSQKLFDKLDQLLTFSSREDALAAALYSLNCQPTADVETIKNNFLEIAYNAHPDTPSGNADDFWILCVSLEVVRAIQMNPNGPQPQPVNGSKAAGKDGLKPEAKAGNKVLSKSEDSSESRPGAAV